MKYAHFVIVVVAILLAAYLTFQFELFAHEFRANFLYQGDWIGLIMMTILIIAVGGIFKVLASMTSHRKKRGRK